MDQRQHFLPLVTLGAVPKGCYSKSKSLQQRFTYIHYDLQCPAQIVLGLAHKNKIFVYNTKKLLLVVQDCLCKVYVFEFSVAGSITSAYDKMITDSWSSCRLEVMGAWDEP